MMYCSVCGAKTEFRVPADDNRPRHLCNQCNTIHYENPKIICGCLVTYQDKVLLCKRAIEPRSGLWTLPAGFMENGETAGEGALRETYEEAYARPQLGELYALTSIPYISQVYMIFRAELDAPEFGPGPESLEVELFAADEIPWDRLAFQTVTRTLEHWVEDQKTGHFPLHTIDIQERIQARV